MTQETDKSTKGVNVWKIAGRMACPVLVLLAFGSIVFAADYIGWHWAILIAGGGIGLVYALKRRRLKPISKTATANIAAVLVFAMQFGALNFLDPPAYQQYKAEQAQQESTAALREESTQEAFAEPATDKEANIHIITPKEAKTIAYNTVKQLEGIEGEIILAIKQKDRAGYGVYVVKPIAKIMNDWPDWRDKGNEAMEPYSACRVAAGELWNLGDNFKQPPSVERQHSIEADIDSYKQQLAFCKQAIAEH